jgi:hypothetical protein
MPVQLRRYLGLNDSHCRCVASGGHTGRLLGVWMSSGRSTLRASLPKLLPTRGLGRPTVCCSLATDETQEHAAELDPCSPRRDDPVI